MATPLSPARLLAVLRAEGCTVREIRSWRTHERDDETGRAFGPVRGVMCHHTGPYTTESGLIDMVYDGRTGLPGPLAHGVIDTSGVVWLMSSGRANHAGGGDPGVLSAVTGESYGDYPPPSHYHEGSPGAADGNDAFYGFECVNRGDGKDNWPRAQYTAMIRAHAAICRAYGWGAKSVIGHKEWSDQKPDPRGIDMKAFRRDVAACLALPAGDWDDISPLTATDAKRVWNLDFVPAPAASTENPTWAPASYLRDTLLRAQAIEARLSALPDLPDAQVDAIAAALAAHPTLADEIAAKVAEKLASRSGN
ncbi:hypothetical protein SRB5_45100 [Streptomyces sp. RB5]|uniref:N-acetylmuramoyl-L-alanine amidase domain-containing protein n=1 Tax=Streptomyces smaragdinus TaxID=2585196 RepID=A0A7K0CLI5_9ACTN|nr:N-acetylmuramoyl-L-alanine amidase [Streptomyces smaragdinus]MQY14346.1 hypothetical protein [Streptomyces smaragdinus]